MRGVHCQTDARKRQVAGEDRGHVPNLLTSGRRDNAAAPAQMMAAGVNTVVHLSSPPACSCLKLWTRRGSLQLRPSQPDAAPSSLHRREGQFHENSQSLGLLALVWTFWPSSGSSRLMSFLSLLQMLLQSPSSFLVVGTVDACLTFMSTDSKHTDVIDAILVLLLDEWGVKRLVGFTLYWHSKH